MKDCPQMEQSGLRCYCNHVKNYIWKTDQNKNYIQDVDCLIEYENLNLGNVA